MRTWFSSGISAPIGAAGVMLAATLTASVLAGDPIKPCNPLAGSCFEGNGTPGCDVLECCSTVCGLDSFCCDVEWDSLCADTALAQCTAGPVGACCFGDGTCQDGLTAGDCSDVGGAFQGTGTLCADVTCPLAPPNDLCANAAALSLPAVVEGTTVGATVDDSFVTCGTAITAPGVWYSVIGTGTTITASTCPGGFDFDTKLSVFCRSCDVPICVAGNDDDCVDGESGLLSTVSWCAEEGAEYLILVHGFQALIGDFELTVDADDAPCEPRVFCTPTGACCLADGDCLQLSETKCGDAGGAYAGDGTGCEGGFVAYGGGSTTNAFENIAGVGTVAPTASSTDDGGDIVPLGFEFEFFGVTHTEIGVASNGYLTFGSDLTDFTNDVLPDPVEPNNAIFPLWDDWSPNVGGTVQYTTVGAAPNRRFIAQWTGVEHFSGSGPATFQAVLFEGTNAIEFRYATPNVDTPTIGIENGAGDVAYEVDPAGIGNGSATGFFPQLSEPAACGILTNPRLCLHPLDTCINPTGLPEQVFVEVRLLDLEGTPGAAAYQAFIEFDTNKLTFVNGKYSNDYFGLPVADPIEEIEPGLIRIAAGIDVLAGDPIVTVDALLATLEFAPKTEHCKVNLDFCREGCQEIIVADITGAPLQNLRLEKSPDIALDGSAPRIKECCPAVKITTEKDCIAEVPDLSTCVVANDNCTPANELVVTQFPAAGSPIGLGTTVVTIIVTDCAGNSTMCQTPVTVHDDDPPTITHCPNDRLLKADNDCMTRVPDLLGELQAIDNCDNSTMLTLAQDPAPDTPITIGNTTVTITVGDDFGNTASCTVRLNVIDANPPKIAECAPDMTLKADDKCQAIVPDLVTGHLTAVDNCTVPFELTVVQAPPAGTVIGLGVTEVSVVVTDAVGLSDTCTVELTVIDNLPPTLENCPKEIVLGLDANCQAKVPDILDGVVATDACGPVALEQSKDVGNTILGQGTLVLTITATDQAGNTTACDVTITTIDELPPTVVQCSPSMKIPANEDCQAKLPQVFGGVVAVDNCSASVSVTQDPPAGTMLDTGTTTVVLTITDDKGNATTCGVDVFVNDQAAPEITCPANIVAECEGGNGAFVAFEATATDDCDTDIDIDCYVVDADTGEIGRELPDGGADFPIGRTLVLCVATDNAGNTDQCHFTVAVHDTTAPKIDACPADLTLEADEKCEARVPDLRDDLLASDLCDDDLTVNQAPAPGSTLLGQGTYLVTFTVLDSAGNSSSCKATITVLDKEAPYFTRCSNDVAIKAGQQCLTQIPDLLIGVAAADNCAEAVTITQDPPASTQISLGTHLVTFTATDDKGNSRTCSVTVTVDDETDPIIYECPDDVELKADDLCEALIPDLSGVIAKDNCDDELDVVQWPEAGAVTTLGVTPVVVTVTDDSGNATSCTVLVTVIDTIEPRLTCPEDIKAEVTFDHCSIVLDPGTATATDNCDDDVKIKGYRSDGLLLDEAYPLGVTTIRWTAEDDSGNKVECTQTITVNDTVAPKLTCPADVTRNADPGLCSIEIQVRQATARDNCDDNLLVTGVRSDQLDLKDPYPAGTTTITWAAEDDAGNVSECVQTISVSSDNSLVVDVELAGGVSEGPLTRCITFELWHCGNGGPTIVEQELTFINGVARNALVKIPCGLYDCVTARDRLHTLRRTDLLEVVAGKQYEADFTDENALIGGNLNDDDIIDIIDWATFAGQFLQVFGSGDVACDAPWDPVTNPHADISGNGFVFIEDHTFVSANFRATDDPNCCGGGIGAATDALDSISVEDLYARGLGHLSVADLNADGFVDEADMEALADGVQPQPRREFAAKEGSWFDAGNWTGNDRPRENTDVVIDGATVLVDRDGAIARNVRVAGNAALVITDGSLAAASITVQSGSTLLLDDVRALLQVTDLTLDPGAALVWNAGTIEVEAAFTSDEAVVLGAEGEALLSLLEGAVVTTPHLVVGPRGEMLADGLVVGNLTNDGLLQPQNLTVEGSFAQNGELVIDADATDIVVTGDAVLGGILTIEPAALHAGTRSSFLHAASVTGRFVDVRTPRLPGLRPAVSYQTTRVVLVVISKIERPANPLTGQ